MKLSEMTFARRTYEKRPGVNKRIVSSHEDDVSIALSHFALEGPKNGRVPIYIYVSPDDESFFFSNQPITSDRIRKELGSGFVGLDYADRGEVE